MFHKGCNYNTNFNNVLVCDDENAMSNPPTAVLSLDMGRNYQQGVNCPVLSSHVNGEVYHQFLQDTFAAPSYDVPFGLSVIMWFIHDHAPAHYALIGRKLLNEIFGVQWIGSEAPVLRLARQLARFPHVEVSENPGLCLNHQHK
jgi:hypothetical protein